MIEITEPMLDGLREAVFLRLSPKRFRHTVAVEQMVARLCALYCPEQTPLLRAAALLHDLTKERTPAEQETLCGAYGLPVTPQDRLAPKTLHARTAAAMIPEEFPQFADEVILSAVRWHTTGRGDMTLTEQLLYLADYIDQSRTYENCVILRRYFWGAGPQDLPPEQRAALLRDTLILSFDMTIRDLLAERTPVAPETVQARNRLLAEAAEH